MRRQYKPQTYNVKLLNYDIKYKKIDRLSYNYRDQTTKYDCDCNYRVLKINIL